MNYRGVGAIALLVWLAGAPARADTAAQPWRSLDALPPSPPGTIPNARPRWFHAWSLDAASFRELLAEAPPDDAPAGLILSLPSPDGVPLRFEVFESPIMEPGLAETLPDVRTFRARGVDLPTATARFDISPRGVTALVLDEPDPSGRAASYMIAPFDLGDDRVHVAYHLDRYGMARTFVCRVIPNPDVPPAGRGAPSDPELRSGTQLRTLRTAVSATGEFTQSAGGTVAAGQGAVVTLLNTINAVYEREFSIRLTLVANNTQLIFTDPATDPFDNADVVSMLFSNQTAVDDRIGRANYDVGHIFARGGGGGVAFAPAVCTNNRAGGVSSVVLPFADPYNVFLIAHEFGHQFGALHTFNGNNATNCLLNRTAADAVEPGGGSTIMSYGGICGPDNIVSVADPYFHVESFDAVLETAIRIPCGVLTPTGNSIPTVNAGPDFSIPIDTPFTLTATGSDPDGDPLTYRWEQWDFGPPVALVAPDNGRSPILRSRPATSSPSRTFPPLPSVLAGTAPAGERLPTVARAMRMRATALDGRGGRSDDQAVLTVVQNAGPFRVTSFPTPSIARPGPTTITWNPARTNLAPINTGNVRITLSTDGGATFPTVLAVATANDGVHTVTLPNVSTSAARIRIEAVGNVFFDVNDANFSIVPRPASPAFDPGPVTLADATGNGNANGVADPGETALRVTVGVVNASSGSLTSITGVLSALTATASVDPAPASFAAALAPGAAATNATPFILSLAPSHPCGAPVSLRLTLSTAQGPATLTLSIPTGARPPVSAPVAFTYTGPAVPITDASGGSFGPIVSVPLNVAGLSGSIADVDVRFDGTACSANPASTSVGLSHAFISDLSISVRHPDGTIVPLATRPGGAANAGSNFCQTVFDDAAILPTIQGIATAQAPFSGSYTANGTLAAFNGRPPNGTWNLRFRDWREGDVGTVRSFSLLIRTQQALACTPPSATCPCPADFDGSSGTPDGSDIDAFFAAWIAGSPAADTDCSGGTPDGDDISTFFTAWINGGC